MCLVIVLFLHHHRACFSETWEQFAVPLAALERLSGRFTASAASEIKRAADTILAPLVREVVSGAMAEAAYDLDESAFTLCEARDPWAKFLIDQLFGLDVMRMFDQLCKPLLGGSASKNAIQMVWGALLCKIGVDTGIIIDVQSSRSTHKRVVFGNVRQLIQVRKWLRGLPDAVPHGHARHHDPCSGAK